MHGMVGRIVAVEGRREALVAILLEQSEMEGCLHYGVGLDRNDPDAVVVSEVWESAESHKASLELAAVRDAIARARPLIAGFETLAETEIVGGIGVGNPPLGAFPE